MQPASENAGETFLMEVGHAPECPQFFEYIISVGGSVVDSGSQSGAELTD